METLHGGYTLEVYEGCFPLSTDSMALAHFAKLPRQARVLDLGAGCGTLGLLLCARHTDCHVTGLELDPRAHQAALENIRRNGLEARLESVQADLRQADVPVGGFDVCISNPPYFSGGPAARLKDARRTDTCSAEALFAAAARALKFGGDFFLVHRPETLAQLFSCASSVSLEPKRLCLLRHRSGDPVSLVLVQCRKGGKPGLKWEEIHLFSRDGSPTEAHNAIYHQ